MAVETTRLTRTRAVAGARHNGLFSRVNGS
jgi:hypothetical protein